MPNHNLNSPRQRRPCALIPALLLAAIPLAAPISAAPVPAPVPAPVLKSRTTYGQLISSRPYQAPASIPAAATLLIHTMPGVTGISTRATTLLFVPRGAAPAGGWTVVAWAHGTTTLGQRNRAPSLSPMLDGGLTADGFPTDYVSLIASLVKAGYAVVAPDLEGLGAAATVPYPYYNAASSARSMLAGVRAARHANPRLSNRWALVGHSDGGRAVLAVEAFAEEAPELNLRGTFALAPLTSIGATVAALSQMAAKNPAQKTALVTQQNFLVAAMATGLLAQTPSYDPRPVMGADLQRLLPVLKTQGAIPATILIAQAVTAKTLKRFAGFKSGWNRTPRMRAFLAANDPAVTLGFTLRLPTFIAEGAKDSLVLEPLAARFSSRLIQRGAPVTYRRYAGADHSTILRVANADMLAFLKGLFALSK